MSLTYSQQRTTPTIIISSSIIIVSIIHVCGPQTCCRQASSARAGSGLVAHSFRAINQGAQVAHQSVYVSEFNSPIAAQELGNPTPVVSMHWKTTVTIGCADRAAARNVCHGDSSDFFRRQTWVCILTVLCLDEDWVAISSRPFLVKHPFFTHFVKRD
eukprot:880808-Amphidinium_carterae.1